MIFKCNGLKDFGKIPTSIDRITKVCICASVPFHDGCKYRDIGALPGLASYPGCSGQPSPHKRRGIVLVLDRTFELQTLTNYTLHTLIAFTLSCIREICIHCRTTYGIIEYVAMASSTYIYTQRIPISVQCRAVSFSVFSNIYIHIKQSIQVVRERTV